MHTMKQPPHPHIIIHISGGCCRTVYCSDPKAKVEVIDMDNAKAGEPAQVAVAMVRLEWADNNLTEVA